MTIIQQKGHEPKDNEKNNKYEAIDQLNGMLYEKIELMGWLENEEKMFN